LLGMTNKNTFRRERKAADATDSLRVQFLRRSSAELIEGYADDRLGFRFLMVFCFEVARKRRYVSEGEVARDAVWLCCAWNGEG
jgi:hypothetical protein